MIIMNKHERKPSYYRQRGDAPTQPSNNHVKRNEVTKKNHGDTLTILGSIAASAAITITCMHNITEYKENNRAELSQDIVTDTSGRYPHAAVQPDKQNIQVVALHPDKNFNKAGATKSADTLYDAALLYKKYANDIAGWDVGVRTPIHIDAGAARSKNDPSCFSDDKVNKLLKSVKRETPSTSFHVTTSPDYKICSKSKRNTVAAYATVGENNALYLNETVHRAQKRTEAAANNPANKKAAIEGIQQLYGTLAHEQGHLLGLGHRGVARYYESPDLYVPVANTKRKNRVEEYASQSTVMGQSWQHDLFKDGTNTIRARFFDQSDLMLVDPKNTHVSSVSQSGTEKQFAIGGSPGVDVVSINTPNMLVKMPDNSTVNPHRIDISQSCEHIYPVSLKLGKLVVGNMLESECMTVATARLRNHSIDLIPRIRKDTGYIYGQTFTLSHDPDVIAAPSGVKSAPPLIRIAPRSTNKQSS